MNLRKKIKDRETPLTNILYHCYRFASGIEMPAPKIIWKAIYMIHKSTTAFFSRLLHTFYFVPLFKSQCANKPKGLFLFGGLPHIAGNIELRIGNNCRIPGMLNINGWSRAEKTPLLKIGDNSVIGWRNVISVADKIIIGNNVLLAGGVHLAGYPGHPLDPKSRREGKPESPEEVGSIIIGNDVWLATGVKVLAGVTIGEGSVVGMSSVVTKDIPPNCLAAGIPAKVIRKMD